MIPLRDTNPTQSTPIVTIVLIALNVLVFLGELALQAQGQFNQFIMSWGVIPAELTSQFLREWPTLFSAMFMHGGWAHLLGNMLYLWIFGDNIEDRLGSGRFLLFYIVAGLAATTLQVAINPGSQVPNIGASGAIAGVLGGYLILFPRTQILTLVFRFVTRVPAVIVLGFWFVYQFILGVTSLGQLDAQTGGVAFFAHVGGFVAGMVLIKPFGIGLVPQDGDRETYTPYDRRDRDPWDF